MGDIDGSGPGVGRGRVIDGSRRTLGRNRRWNSLSRET